MSYISKVLERLCCFGNVHCTECNVSMKRTEHNEPRHVVTSWGSHEDFTTHKLCSSCLKALFPTFYNHHYKIQKEHGNIS
jgi:hypothetical protein